jgi:hypothetical protein
MPRIDEREQEMREWTGSHILLNDVTESNQMAVLGELEAYNITEGYLCEDRGWAAFVPTNVRALVVEALVEGGIVERRQALQLAKDARPMTLGTALNVMNINRGRRPNRGRNPIAGSLLTPIERVPSRRATKFATLICFEGSNAEACADAYTAQVRSEIFQKQTNLITTPEFFAKHYGVTVCCVDLHNCQKHQLKG